jgi:hypothetical protein
MRGVMDEQTRLLLEPREGPLRPALRRTAG